ncbi:MAG: DUF4157 domain-containing protein [Anaerolineales bacterium]
MKGKVFERKRRGKARLQKASTKEASHVRSRESEDKHRLGTGLEALRRGGPQALTVEGIGALQRHVSNSDLQRLVGDEGFVATPSLEADLEREQGSGSLLSTPVRGEMEGAFGADLGAVRVHTDAKANELSRGLGAYAFAYGRDIYFADGEYAPATTSGQHLLAHELAHVVQQGAGAKLMVGGVHDPAEREADRVADEVVRAIRRGESAVRRQEDIEEGEWAEVQMVRRQVDLEEEEEGLPQPIRQWAKGMRQAGSLFGFLNRVSGADMNMIRRYSVRVLWRTPISREMLVAQLTRYGQFQLASILPQEMRAVDSAVSILDIALLTGVRSMLVGLEEMDLAPGGMAEALYGVVHASLEGLRQRWVGAVSSDNAIWSGMLPLRAFQFAEGLENRELDSNMYSVLEQRFWQSLGMPSREDAEVQRWNQICRTWNASLRASQIFAAMPALATRLLLVPESERAGDRGRPGAGRGE